MIKEVFINKIRETAVNVVQTQIDSIKKKDITKTGYRVYKDGLIGTAGAIGAFDELKLEKMAQAALETKIPYPYQVSTDRKEKVDCRKKIMDEEGLVEEFADFLAQLREEQPDFSFSHKLTLTEYETRLYNSAGLELEYRDRLLEIILLFKDKRSVNVIDGFIPLAAREYKREKYLKKINEVCNAYKNEVELPEEGKMPIIFATFEPLPLKKFMLDLHGNRFGSGGSLFSEKLDEQVFSDRFTLYQTHHPEDEAVPFFDAEGVINDSYRYALIEKGRIISPYTDKKVAEEYQLPLTGSAVSEYDSVPSLGIPKFKIEEANRTTAELLQGRKAIFVIFAEGGDFTPEGNFATPVQLAMLFDGEKLVGRLPELKLSSNIYEMFGPSWLGSSSDAYFPMLNHKNLLMELNVAKL